MLDFISTTSFLFRSKLFAKYFSLIIDDKSRAIAVSQQAFTYSKSTIEMPRKSVKSVQSQHNLHSFVCWGTMAVIRSGVFIVNFEQISQIVLVFPLFTLNK